MSVELLQNKVHRWNSDHEKDGAPVLVGFKQAPLLLEAQEKKYDVNKLRLCASRKLPWAKNAARSSMVTLVFKDSAVRKQFMLWSGWDRWYYYSQPPCRDHPALPVRAYIDLDAHDSKDMAGVCALESFAKNELWPAFCDFLKVPPASRTFIVSTNHKVDVDENSYVGSLHIQSTNFGFVDIFHYSRCFHAFLRAFRNTDLMKTSWKLYGGKSSKNAQAFGVIDAAPVGRETGTGYHKWNETKRKHDPGLDVWDYDILDVSPGAYMIKKLNKPLVIKNISRDCASPSALPSSEILSPQIDPSWFKAAEFATTAIDRMEPTIFKYTGSMLSAVRLSRLSRPSTNPDGADHMVIFPSTAQSKMCVLSGVCHGSNNIKMMLSLLPPKVWVGCHSTKRDACNRWRLVYEEKMSPLEPPAEPTGTIPASVVGPGTHIELGVWTQHPFRLSLPGHEDITNRSACCEYSDLVRPFKMCNIGGCFMHPEILKKRTSRVAKDLCFALRPLLKRSTDECASSGQQKKQRTCNHEV